MLIAAALLALPLLALFAVAAGRREWSHSIVYAGCFIASASLFAGSLQYLGSGAGAPALVLPMGLPWMKAHFRIDNLSALFLLMINLSAAAASAFAVGYSPHLPQRRRITPFFPLFLLGMNMVLAADDAFVFLVAWEFMSLSSWLMVVADHEDAENRRAGQVYLMMAAFGTFCLLPAFGLMAGPGGDYTFAAMRLKDLGVYGGFLAALLTILGTGSKAGLMPLHAWLPLAHPAAPSHVSALMSGVMTKVALYALIRVLLDLHSGLAWEWGTALMVIGGLTAVLGVLYAVMQDDLKKLLAYSTVENIGVAVIGIGLAVAFKGTGHQDLAALALVAGLYHMINHSVFKTLLFLGAGAVVAATGRRSLGGLGGLLKRMPWTGAAFLVGAAAISALPPLNGFVSEWLILQSLFKGPSVPHWAMKFGVPVVGALLALAAALAAGCFVRAYGIAFLGRPRSTEAAECRDVTMGMRWTMAFLAMLCIILGVIPVTITDALTHVVKPLTGVQLAVSADLGWPWLSPVSARQGSYSGTVLVLTGAILLTLAGWAAHRLGSRALRRADAWDCGHLEDISNSQYTGRSFAQPLRRAFTGGLFQARETVTMPEPGDLTPAKHHLHMIDPIWDGLYAPLGRVIDWIADHVNRLQYLTVRGYLLMMFLTLVFMLLVVAVRQQL